MFSTLSTPSLLAKANKAKEENESRPTRLGCAAVLRFDFFGFVFWGLGHEISRKTHPKNSSKTPKNGRRRRIDSQRIRVFLFALERYGFCKKGMYYLRYIFGSRIKKVLFAECSG